MELVITSVQVVGWQSRARIPAVESSIDSRKELKVSFSVLIWRLMFQRTCAAPSHDSGSNHLCTSNRSSDFFVRVIYRVHVMIPPGRPSNAEVEGISKHQNNNFTANAGDRKSVV